MKDDENKKTPKFTFRASKQELAEIDRRARKAKMSRTDFLLACAKAPEGSGQLNGKQQRQVFKEVKTIAQNLEAVLKTHPLIVDKKGSTTDEVELKLGDELHDICKKVELLHGR
jgi:hypothetical protein